LSTSAASQESERKKQTSTGKQEQQQQQKQQNQRGNLSMSNSARISARPTSVTANVKESTSVLITSSPHQSMYADRVRRKSKSFGNQNTVFELCTSGAIKAVCQSLLSREGDIRLSAADLLLRCNDAANACEVSEETYDIAPVQNTTSSLSLIWNAALIEQVGERVTQRWYDYCVY